MTPRPHHRLPPSKVEAYKHKRGLVNWILKGLEDGTLTLVKSEVQYDGVKLPVVDSNL